MKKLISILVLAASFMLNQCYDTTESDALGKSEFVKDSDSSSVATRGIPGHLYTYSITGEDGYVCVNLNNGAITAYSAADGIFDVDPATVDPLVLGRMGYNAATGNMGAYCVVILSFNTASIPSGATITGAWLEIGYWPLQVDDFFNELPPDPVDPFNTPIMYYLGNKYFFDFAGSNGFSNNFALERSDLYASHAFSVRKALVLIDHAAGYHWLPDSSWPYINKSGKTQIRLKFVGQVFNNHNLAYGVFGLHSGVLPGPSPVLEVAYDCPITHPCE